MFKVGNKVKAVRSQFGWGSVSAGDIGVITQIGSMWEDYSYVVNFPNSHRWVAGSRDLELVPVKPEKRTAKKLVPSTHREVVAVRLVNKVIKGEGKFTAVKVESEGNIGRTDRCTPNCTRRNEGIPHVGCKYFPDVKVANDFILRHLAKYGLAKRCKAGENVWGYLYTPKLPLVFSKVYTDSETEWTTTLSLKNASDVLYTPMLVDAFNALATANGNGINVQYSGMHTAFIQGIDGIYPDPKGTTREQGTMFKNFAKSMRPLLPALYLLGANRIEDGKGVTRSTGCRQPLISASEKYSAIAYRYGAVEFRVFDTCYDNRDQILDNIVVMSQAISKYWHVKYVKPNISLDKPVFFGTSEASNSPVYPLENLYVVKDHVVLLNAGLRCIKPPYMTVKEVKRLRNFNLTVRTVKNILDTDVVRDAYARHLRDIEVTQLIQGAREFYREVQNLAYSSEVDVKKFSAKLRAKAARSAKRQYPAMPIESVAYKTQFGQGYSLGEN